MVLAGGLLTSRLGERQFGWNKNNLKILYQLQKAARFFEIKNILPLTQYILRIQLFLYIFVEYFLSLVEFVAIKVLPLKL